jgi:hypothetical protein
MSTTSILSQPTIGSNLPWTPELVRYLDFLDVLDREFGMAYRDWEGIKKSVNVAKRVNESGDEDVGTVSLCIFVESKVRREVFFKVLAIALDYGELNEEDLPTIELLSGKSRVVIKGLALPSTEGWTTIGLKVEIYSHKDRRKVEVPVRTTESGKYLLIPRAEIESKLPQFTALLKSRGLFASLDPSTPYLLLQRLVLAASGAYVKGKDAHHLKGASGAMYGGYTTFDCRAEVLRALDKVEHQRVHMDDAGHHYWRGNSRCVSGAWGRGWGLAGC